VSQKLEVVFNILTADGQKLFLNLLVRQRKLLYRLPDGRRVNSPFPSTEKSDTQSALLHSAKYRFIHTVKLQKTSTKQYNSSALCKQSTDI